MRLGLGLGLVTQVSVGMVLVVILRVGMVTCTPIHYICYRLANVIYLVIYLVQPHWQVSNQ